MKILGIIASSILKKITDAFNRTTSGSLGNTDTGQPWVATRGTWYANGSAAQSDDAASTSTPSIASVSFGKTDVAVSASVSGGTGPVFWLTDSGSWWSAVSYNTSTSTCPNGNCSGTQTVTGTRSCSCFTQTCTRSCSCSYSTTIIDYYPNSPGYVLFCQQQGGSYNPSTGACSVTTQSSTCNSGACSGTESFSCLQSTCNNGSCSGTESYNYDQSCSCTYNYYLRLLQSVSGTVSTATSDVSLASQAAAIMVQTAAGAITAKAYSDTAMTTQLGTTINLTPVSPTQGTSVGIVKYTSPYNQGSTVDNFLAQ